MMTNAKKEIVERIVEREVIRLMVILSFMRIDFPKLLLLILSVTPLYCIELYCVVFYRIVLFSTELYCIAFFCTASHCIVCV